MQQLDELINAIWQDGHVDQDEKKGLKQLAMVSDLEELAYLRNRSFDLAQEKMALGINPEVVLRSLEKVVKQLNSIQLLNYGSQHFACFSPGDECRDTITTLLAKAKSKVDICVFTISDNIITKAILDAYKKGVSIRVVTDNDKSNDKGSDIDHLIGQGVPVVMDRSDNHMHHKFAIIDDKLINGSFNWTRSASKYNQENITVNNSQKLIELFSTQFDALWKEYS